jgi:outer membrane immunogenic protein
MFRTQRLAIALLGATLVAAPAVAQENEKSEVSVQVFGSFVKTTTDDGIPQSASNSAGVLASYRFFFAGNQGVEVNYGYSRNTQSYGLPTGSEGVEANQHEFSAAYVYRRHLGGITPFVEAGVGALVFSPTSSSMLGAIEQARAAFVYGAGADFKLVSRAFVRAEYRGLVYDSPTFGLSPALGPDRVTNRAEPSIGFGYRF